MESEGTSVVIDPLPYASRDLFLMNALVRHMYAICEEAGDEVFLVLNKTHAYWVRNLFGDLKGLRLIFMGGGERLDASKFKSSRIVRVDCASLKKTYQEQGLKMVHAQAWLHRHFQGLHQQQV